MSELLYHPATKAAINQCIVKPSHALMLVGPTGSGKAETARSLAAELLKLSVQKLDTYPFVTFIRPEDNKAISIEAIRELQHYITLKIPGSRNIARIAIIEDAHMLTIEAQNALLKTLEEPPIDTVIILTAASTDALLPTILSRVQALPIVPPDLESLKQYFNTRGFKSADIDKALLVSGGLPGLTHALLLSQEEHPLFKATQEARKLLQGTAYDRLLLVDTLSKQKQLVFDLLFILGQMSRTALLRNAGDSRASIRWKKIMQASYAAREQLSHNTSAKLVLTNLMLEL
jgi:DNA polymerase-3 subunit delta'